MLHTNTYRKVKRMACARHLFPRRRSIATFFRGCSPLLRSREGTDLGLRRAPPQPGSKPPFDRRRSSAPAGVLWGGHAHPRRKPRYHYSSLDRLPLTHRNDRRRADARPVVDARRLVAEPVGGNRAAPPPCRKEVPHRRLRGEIATSARPSYPTPDRNASRERGGQQPSPSRESGVVAASVSTKRINRIARTH